MTNTTLLDRLKNLSDSPEHIYSVIDDVAPEVCARNLSLQEVVEALGTSLTHERPRIREVGTQFLAKLLSELPPSYLNQAEVTFLTAFLVDRMHDQHTVQPAVFLGCLALVKQTSLGDTEVVSLFNSIFREVQVQAHVVSDRRIVYNFFKYCISNRVKALKDLGLSLLPGIISAVESERDPRNLLVVFSIIKALINSGLTLQPFVEELFEVLAIYFPIEFVPPRGDPYAIQTEDLILGLREVLAATPLFAPYCLPLLEEKMESELISSKLDSLHTLVSCCQIYTADDLHSHSYTLWNNIRREILQGPSKEVEEAALSALSAVMGVLEGTVTTTASRAAAAKLINEALTECECHLKTPDQRLMWPSTRLLVALVVAAPGPAITIIHKVVPLLTSQSMKGGNVSALGRQNSITALAMIVEAAIKHSSLLLEGGAISQCAEQVWDVFKCGLSCSSTDEEMRIQESTVSSLPSVIPALPSPYLEWAAQHLTALLLELSSSSIRDGINKCLVRLVQHSPDIVLNHTLPLLLAALSNESSSSEREKHILDSLACLSLTKAVLPPVLTEMWRITNTLLDTGECSSLDRCDLYLSTLTKLVGSTVADSERQKYLLEEWQGIKEVIGMFARLVQQHTPTVAAAAALISLASTLRTLVALESNPQPLIQHLVRLTVCGSKETESITETDTQHLLDTSTTSLFTSCLDHTHSSPPKMLFALEAVLAGAQKIPDDSTSLLLLLKKVRDFITSTTDAQLKEAALLIHAVTINKLQQGSQLSQAEEDARNDVNVYLQTSQPQEKRLAALLITIWTSKALVVRGSNLQQWWNNKLLEVLADPHLGVTCASSFETIVKDHPYALTTACHANVRLLHKQRFFETVVHHLVDTFTASNGSVKTCYQVALCSLLPHLPQVILAPHVDKVFPVVLQGVNISGQKQQQQQKEVVQSIVDTLVSLLSHSPTPATKHLSFLLPALLSYTLKQPLSVRVKSLECLDALARLPTTTLLPYRDDVQRGLKSVLNDHKRVVRQRAAKTRTLWIMVGAPGTS